MRPESFSLSASPQTAQRFPFDGCPAWAAGGRKLPGHRIWGGIVIHGTVRACSRSLIREDTDSASSVGRRSGRSDDHSWAESATSRHDPVGRHSRTHEEWTGCWHVSLAAQHIKDLSESLIVERVVGIPAIEFILCGVQQAAIERVPELRDAI